MVCFCKDNVLFIMVILYIVVLIIILFVKMKLIIVLDVLIYEFMFYLS